VSQINLKKKLEKVDGPDAKKTKYVKLNSSWNQANLLLATKTPNDFLFSRINSQRSGSSF
jgi:hypothetical protein